MEYPSNLFGLMMAEAERDAAERKERLARELQEMAAEAVANPREVRLESA